MKIAITGKGGVGKTTLSALLSCHFVEKGQKVFAIDADPDANLALALGYPHPEQITPLVEMKELIEERTGAKIGAPAPFFKMNPRVDDIPDKYFVSHEGVKIAVMGTIRGGGMGCACPENAFLKSLLTHLILYRNEVVILDMEAGIEHLGRATAGSVDRFIVVVEPGRRSIETARRINELSGQIGVKNFALVGNKIRTSDDRKYLEKNTPDMDFLGFIPYDERVVKVDMGEAPLSSITGLMKEHVERIVSGIMEKPL